MIKGSSAKRQMVGQLYGNLLTILQRVSSDIGVRKFSDKIEVLAPLSFVPEVRELLLNTSGIEQILEAVQYDEVDTLEQIKEHVEALVGESLEGKSFVVRAKRTGTHPFNSMQIESTLGGYLLAKTKAKAVSLKNPDVIVSLELVNRQLNIITKRYKGLSGFPLGTQGDVLSLMSGGFDSTVASYLTMKRGIKTHFIFFNLGGKAHEIGVKQVALYLWSKYGSSHRVKFISVPFDDVVTEIFNATSQSYMGVMLKRLMLMAAEKIAKHLEIDALVTGESVAQVSSQTLRNLALIDQATDMLVLRPLSTMNKPEIIAIADEIGTRYFAESMPEYCGVISQNPIIHGSYKRMEKEAQHYNYEVLDKAISDAKTIYVDEVLEDVKELAAVEVVTEPHRDAVIIDIRGQEETLESCYETLNIPFYKLKSEFPKLDKDKKYLLYCEKGIMSQLHAQYLRDAKICEDIKVYRPS